MTYQYFLRVTKAQQMEGYQAVINICESGEDGIEKCLDFFTVECKKYLLEDLVKFFMA